MERSWLSQWFENRFGRSFQRTASSRRRKARTRLEVERLEDRTMFATAIWTGAYVNSTAPPVPWPTQPPFPPTPPQGNPFDQPYWSLSQNWLNGYIPQKGDNIIFPAISSSNQFTFGPTTTWGALAVYNSIDDLPNLTQLGTITIEGDGYAIGYEAVGNNGVPSPWGGTNQNGSTIELLNGNAIVADSNYTGTTSFLDLDFTLTGNHQNVSVANAGAILEVGHQANDPATGNLNFAGHAGSISDAAGDNGGLVMQGLGMMKLSGSNTYTNLTEVNSGTLEVATLPGSAGANTTVDNGATLTLERGTSIGVNNTMTIQGAGVGNNGALQVQAGGAATWNGNVILNAPTSMGSFGAFPFPNTLTVASGSTSITGTGGITKVGGGRLILPGNDSYSGANSIDAGSIEIQNNNSLGNSSLTTTTILSGATLEVTAGVDSQEPITVNGSGVSNGAVNYEPAIFGMGTATLAGTINVATNSTVGAALNQTLTLSGQFSGSATFDETTPGVVEISNTNNSPFTGVFQTDNGFLLFVASGAFGNASNVLVNSGGTVEVEGTFTTPVAVPITLNGLGAAAGGALEAELGTTNVTWAGSITLGSTASIGTDLASTVITVAGTISGPANANLEKAGLGLVTLAGVNPNFLGGTVIRAGTLAVSAALALGPSSGGQVQVFSGATLQITNSITVNKTLALAGTGVGNLGALQSLSGTNTWSGSVNLADPSNHGNNANGIAQLGAFIGVAPGTQLTLSGTLSGISMTIVTNGTLVLAGSSGNTFSGTIVDDTPGEVDLAKTGGVAISGSLVVGDAVASNAFGSEVVRYKAAGPQIASSGGTVTINPSGLLDLNNFSDALEAIILNGGTSPNITTGTGVLTINGGLTVTPFPGSALPSQLPTSAEINGNVGIGTGTQVMSLNHNASLADDLTITGVVSGAAANTLDITGPSAQQTVTVGGTGGTFTLTFDGQTTGNLAFGASAAAVSTALNALASIGGVGGSVGVGLAGSVYTVTFGGSLAGTAVPQLQATGSGGATTAVATTISGAGNLLLNGTAANTFAGTILNQGVLDLQDSAGSAVVGPLSIQGTVRDHANNQLATAPVSIGTTGLLDVNGFSDSVASLTMTGGSGVVASLANAGGYVNTGAAGLLTLGGNVVTNASFGPATINGNLSLGPVTRTFTVALGTASPADLIINGVLSNQLGAGFTKAGAGQMQLAGTSANTYTGTTTVAGGTLLLATSGIAIPGNLVVGIGTGSANSSIVSLGAANQISSSAAVTFNNDGEMLMNDNSVSFALLTMYGGDIQTGTLASTTLTLQSDVAGGLAPGSITPTEAFIQGAGQLSLGGVSRTFNITASGSNQDMTVAVTIVDGGANPSGIVKVGSGTLIFSGANTYRGQTVVNAGFLQIQNNKALGGAASPSVTVANAAALQLAGGITVTGATASLNGNGGPASGPNGALENVSGNNTWAGPISLATSASIGADVTSKLTITGLISGIGSTGLTKVGTGTVDLAGSQSNTYQGATTVTTGILQLGMTGGAVAIPTTLVVGTAGSISSPDSDVVQLLAAGQFNTTQNITINNGGLLDLNGFATTIGPLTLDAGDVNTNGGNLTLASTVTTLPAATSSTIRPTNAVQTVTVTGASGTYTLTFNSQTTGSLAFNATAAQVQAALNSLGSIGGVGGSVAVTLAGSTYTITFGGTLAGVNVPSITANYGTIATATTTQGSATQNEVQTAAVTVNGTPTGGFTLTFNASTTPTLAWTSTAAQVQAALNALPSIGGVGGSVTVSPNTVGNTTTFTITFGGTLADTNVPQTTGASSTPSVAVSTAVTGGSGTVTLSVPTTFNVARGTGVNADGTLIPDLIINATIIGPSQLNISGTGILVLKANNAYSGPTTVLSGTLLIDGNQGSIQTLVQGGTLGGTGTSGPITATAGTVSPGDAPISLKAGILNVNGSVNLGSNSTVNILIVGNSSSPGSDFSQLHATGQINLNSSGQTGSTLQVTVNVSNLAINIPLTILLADSGVLNKFSNPVTFVANARTYTLTYNPTNVVLNHDSDISQTVVTSNVNPSVWGQPVILTATVSSPISGIGTPTGTVIFYDNGVQIPGFPAQTLVNGSASITVSNFAVNTPANPFHPITAVYTPGTGSTFAGSTSAVYDQVVNQDSTSVALNGSPPSPILFGQPVSFTATVTIGPLGAGTPTGTVKLLDGTTVLQTQPLPANGVVTFNLAGLPVGAGQLITAQYSGDTNFATSTSSPLPYTVNPDPTTTTLSANASSPLVYGQTVTFTATVTPNPPGSGTLTGTVALIDGGTTLATQNLPANGVVTFTIPSASIPALGVGTGHIIVAAFTSSNGNFANSNSAPQAFTVTQDTTHTALTATVLSPLVYGQSVSFTATVTPDFPGSGTPTGTVALEDGTTVLQTLTLPAGSNQVTFNLIGPVLAVGNGHSITAVYSGDVNFITSTSPALPYTVTKASTTTTIAASAPSPLVFGQPLSFTVTVAAVAPGSGTPTGSVQLFDGTTVVQTLNLPSSGTVTFQISGLATGSSHTYKAVYSGDGNFITSTSAPTTYTVNQDPTTTSMTALPASPTVFGEAVAFTVTVSPNAPGSGTPTGTVTLQDVFNGKTITLGSQSVPTTGQVTFQISTLAVTTAATGTHSITAQYSGDTNFTSSASTAQVYTVNQDGTTTTLKGSANSPVVFGQPLSFTATVAANAPGSGTPTGTVTLFDGTTSLQTSNLPASGSVTFQITSGLTVGSTHAYKAVYSGDGNFTGSPSSVLNYTVNQDPTTTALNATPSNPSNYGQAVTLSASVTPHAPGSGTPTGSVKFFDGSKLLDTATLPATGTITFVITLPTVGNHTFSAQYSGDGNFIASTSASLPYKVNPDPTTTTLTASAPSPLVFGQPVTFNAKVTPQDAGAGVATGVVELLNGTTVLQTQPLSGTGTASFLVTGLAVANNYSFSAQYVNSDGNFVNSASAAQAYVVNPDPTTTTIAPSANPSVFGQIVNFVVTVAANSPGSGTPAGSVVLKDTFNGSTTTLGTSALANGQASFSISSLAPGQHSLSASFTPGNGNFVASSSAGTPQTVNQDPTTTTVQASINPATYGQSETLTATAVANPPGAGALTGTITFFDGTTTLGTENINVSGSASLTIAAFTAGTHNLTATYSGDTNFLTSTSSTLPLVINQASTSTSISVSAPQIVFGQPETVNTAVTALAPGSGVPTGTVTLLDNGAPIANQTLNSVGAATFQIAALGAGSHSLTVSYATDGNFASSTSPPASVSVATSATSVAVVSSNPVATSGRQVVAFTVTVTPIAPGAGVPTGSVSLFDGSTKLGTTTLTNGQAVFNLSNLLPGTHSISASYTGDSNFTGGSSAPIVQVMHAPNIYAVATDAGGGPQVVVYDADTGNQLFSFFAYSPFFTGGVRVAVGDVMGNGIPDIITIPGPGGGPQINVYDGSTGQLVRSFFAFNPLFSGGAYIAAGDVTGAGFAQIIAGADAGGGPQVTVFNAITGTAASSFFAYSPSFVGGVRVAAGNLNGNGVDSIITGAGYGGGPAVTVFNAAGVAQLNFMAYDPAFNGGIYVAAGDVLGLGTDQIITGPGAQGSGLVTINGQVINPGASIGPKVNVFSGVDGSLLEGFFAYNSQFGGGVRVAAVLQTGATHSDILAVPGSPGGPEVKMVDGLTLQTIDDFFALNPAYSGGLFVAASQL